MNKAETILYLHAQWRYVVVCVAGIVNERMPNEFIKKQKQNWKTWFWLFEAKINICKKSKSNYTSYQNFNLSNTDIVSTTAPVTHF